VLSGVKGVKGVKGLNRVNSLTQLWTVIWDIKGKGCKSHNFLYLRVDNHETFNHRHIIAVT